MRTEPDQQPEPQNGAIPTTRVNRTSVVSCHFHTLLENTVKRTSTIGTTSSSVFPFESELAQVFSPRAIGRTNKALVMVSRRRRAFTLVELLVVIAIIGILVALLLPAVQAARESARRVSCVNNLKQLGIACQTYHDAYGKLPGGGIIEKNIPPTLRFGQFDARAGKQFSWIVLILPQLEQQQLSDSFDFDQDIFNQPLNPQEVQLETLRCPSDRYQRTYFEHRSGVRFAKGNYAGFVSPFHTDLQIKYPGALGGDGLRFSEIVDGLAGTILISEVLTRDHERDQRGVWALPWTGASHLSLDMHHLGGKPLNKTGSFIAWDTPPIPGQTQIPNNEGPNMDILYECPDPNAARLLKMPCESYSRAGYLSAAPRSLHAGGVNAVFLDGHVGFMPDEIDPVTLSYIISINDQRAISVKNHVR